MAASATDKTTAASPNGLSTFLDAAVEAVKAPVVEPAPDPRVSAAFALGWQMAELYRPAPPSREHSAARNDLPGISRLDQAERSQMALAQVEAAVAKLGPAITAAGLEIPPTTALSRCLQPPGDAAAQPRIVRALHVQLLSTLTATDFRLGKAYGLGRALADTCRNPTSDVTLKAEFRPQRIEKLQHWLNDLASALPPHAAHSVSESLSRWVEAIRDRDPGEKAGGQAVPGRVRRTWIALTTGQKTELRRQRAVRPDDARKRLNRQGQLWRSLLSGEKSGPDMLAINNYLTAADELLRTNGVIAWRYVRRFWYLALLAVALFAGGIVLLVLTKKGSGAIVAGAGSILASLGITWKTAGSTVGGLGAKVEHNLWGAEIDHAIADAITLLPGNPSRHQLPKTSGAAQAANQTAGFVPRSELLEPVLNPENLLAKIGAAKKQRAAESDALATLPPEQRVPVDYFDRLAADIKREQTDRQRVTKARTPPPKGGPSAPPPVIYLSRRPSVSQFMSIVTHCFENELTRLERDAHVGALDHLWREVEHWTNDLRSRFREFGPCDIRWLEPKLAQVLADFVGRHRFSTHPPEVAIGEQATVILVGDWATGLPQARNVAARVREHLQLLTANTDIHVIHLGDTYYAGLEDEARRRFLDLWPVAPGSNISSWALAGNHDMYSGGHAYFDVLLADTRFGSQNRCSYFGLHNDHWQILGLDSSYKDPDRADLQDPQRAWLHGRVQDAGSRGTVLLTHHQPFSPYEDVDTPLAASVAQALAGHQVDAWLWGHEHRCAVFDANVQNNSSGYRENARYTAVVGHGGVPNLLSDQQPGSNEIDIKWEFLDYHQVGEDRWGLGGFAVLTFDGPRLEIQYYDEYGKVRRQGEPLGYAEEAASIEQVLQAADKRPECAPDTLYPNGVEPRTGRGEPDRAAAITSVRYSPDGPA